MSEFLYCLEHEKEVFVHDDEGDFGHIVFARDEFDQESIDWCEFESGWATVEPEFEDDEDWELDIPEPSEEEMEQMDYEGDLLWLQIFNNL